MTAPDLRALAEAAGWALEEGVTCVVCPSCAFTFDAAHTDTGGGYSCPACSENDLLDQADRLAETEAAAGIANLAAQAAVRRYKALEADNEHLRELAEATVVVKCDDPEHAERDEWKARAEAAEAELVTVLQALVVANNADEDAMKRLIEAHKEIDQWQERALTLEAELTDLREAAEKRAVAAEADADRLSLAGDHKPGCPELEAKWKECTCGWGASLTEHYEAVAARPKEGETLRSASEKGYIEAVDE